MYQPIYRSNSLTIGQGEPIIVTGWTPQHRVTKYLTKRDYAAVGQLYSTSVGVSYLLRNLLANPWIRHIVAIEATHQDKIAKSISCLCSFIHSGVVDEDGWHRIANQDAYIDSTIPTEALESLRHNVELHKINHLKDTRDTLNKIAQTSSSTAFWAIPQTYPELELSTYELPAANSGHLIRASTIAEGWLNLTYRVMTSGEHQYPETSHTRELLNTEITITDEPQDLHIPEWLPVSRNHVLDYYPQVVEPSEKDNKEDVAYTYGDRIHKQLKGVLKQMKYRPGSRRFTINLWQSGDVNSHQPPCLVNIWFRLTESKKLHMTCVFRSHDVWGAWLANVYALRILQQIICTDHGFSLGSLTILSESAHLYSYDFSAADQIIKDKYPLQPDYSDSVGNFEVTESSINQYHPDTGELVKVYEGKNKRKLVYDVITENPSILPHHAAYLMAEAAQI